LALGVSRVAVTVGVDRALLAILLRTAGRRVRHGAVAIHGAFDALVAGTANRVSALAVVVIQTFDANARRNVAERCGTVTVAIAGAHRDALVVDTEVASVAVTVDYALFARAIREVTNRIGSTAVAVVDAIGAHAERGVAHGIVGAIVGVRALDTGAGCLVANVRVVGSAIIVVRALRQALMVRGVAVLRRVTVAVGTALLAAAKMTVRLRSVGAMGVVQAVHTAERRVAELPGSTVATVVGTSAASAGHAARASAAAHACAAHANAHAADTSTADTGTARTRSARTRSTRSTARARAVVKRRIIATARRREYDTAHDHCTQ